MSVCFAIDLSYRSHRSLPLLLITSLLLLLISFPLLSTDHFPIDHFPPSSTDHFPIDHFLLPPLPPSGYQSIRLFAPSSASFSASVGFTGSTILRVRMDKSAAEIAQMARTASLTRHRSQPDLLSNGTTEGKGEEGSEAEEMVLVEMRPGQGREQQRTVFGRAECSVPTMVAPGGILVAVPRAQLNNLVGPTEQSPLGLCAPRGSFVLISQIHFALSLSGAPSRASAALGPPPLLADRPRPTCPGNGPPPLQTVRRHLPVRTARPGPSPLPPFGSLSPMFGSLSRSLVGTCSLRRWPPPIWTCSFAVSTWSNVGPAPNCS